MKNNSATKIVIDYDNVWLFCEKSQSHTVLKVNQIMFMMSDAIFFKITYKVYYWLVVNDSNLMKISGKNAYRSNKIVVF